MTTVVLANPELGMKRSILFEVLLVVVILSVVVGFLGPHFTGGGAAEGICWAGAALGVQVFVIGQLLALAHHHGDSHRIGSAWMQEAGWVTLISLSIAIMSMQISWLSGAPCGCQS